MVTEVDVLTATVETVNVALVAPPFTVTLMGTVATEVLLLERETVAPDAGAGPFNVRVPADVLPPVTEAGLNATDLGSGGFTVSTAEAVAL